MKVTIKPAEGLVIMGLGLLLSSTVVLAIYGIPMMVFGLVWLITALALRQADKIR